jgi:RNA polymerase sigma-70 factor (ECF subfamily)
MALTAEQFGQLALEQLDTLVRMAVSLTVNRTEADDLVQETYLRAFRARTQFQEREHGLRPWLLRIMHNAHLTRIARAKARPIATDPVNLDAHGFATTRFPAIPPELDDTVRAALADLPADLRSALTLWAVEELSYKEMADVLDIPIGTVMSRLHRARNALAAKLRERSPELLKGTANRYG